MRSDNLDQQPNVLLRNLQGQAFEDVTGSAQLGGPAWSRSPVVGDLNRDGFPDLVVGNADFAPIQGFLLVTATFTMLVYLAVDIIVRAIDPRARVK